MLEPHQYSPLDEVHITDRRKIPSTESIICQPSVVSVVGIAWWGKILPSTDCSQHHRGKLNGISYLQTVYTYDRGDKIREICFRYFWFSSRMLDIVFRLAEEYQFHNASSTSLPFFLDSQGRKYLYDLAINSPWVTSTSTYLCLLQAPVTFPRLVFACSSAPVPFAHIHPLHHRVQTPSFYHQYSRKSPGLLQAMRQSPERRERTYLRDDQRLVREAQI